MWKVKQLIINHGCCISNTLDTLVLVETIKDTVERTGIDERMTMVGLQERIDESVRVKETERRHARRIRKVWCLTAAMMMYKSLRKNAGSE